MGRAKSAGKEAGKKAGEIKGTKKKNLPDLEAARVHTSSSIIAFAAPTTTATTTAIPPPPPLLLLQLLLTHLQAITTYPSLYIMTASWDTPWQIGGTEIRNRFVMSPMTRCRATLDLVPTDRDAETSMLVYYEQRASAGELCAGRKRDRVRMC